MKSTSFLLLAGITALVTVYACNKAANPQPPVYDTVTITKTDTLVLPPVSDTPNLTEGLVLYLPFNGSFADSSGNNSTVTPLGGAALGYDLHGYASSAFSSSGNGARLVVSNNGSYAVDTAFSLSFDFVVRSNTFYYGGGNYTGQMCFLSIIDTTNGQGMTFNCGLMSPTSLQDFTFGVNGSSSNCDDPANNNPQDTIEVTGFAPQIGSWYNAICIFTKGQESVYINGQLMGTATTPDLAALFCPSANFVVGAWWSGGGNPSNLESLNGELDEVRMYNRTLTAQQIAWLSRNFQPTSVSLAPRLKTGKAAGISSH
jgi:Concanavalin A-like lectin/glucanases superfamily